jgi:hypothetical protein
MAESMAQPGYFMAISKKKNCRRPASAKNLDYPEPHF